MANKDCCIHGWKAAERFSFKAAHLQLEIDNMKKERDHLLRVIEELRAENQRLQQLAQY